MQFYEAYVKRCKSVQKSPSVVATDIGLNKSVVTRWKQGSDPSLSVLIAVANYFGVTIDELLNGTIEKENEAMANWVQKRYDALDEHGKKLIDAVLSVEVERCRSVTTKPTVIRHYLYSPAAGVNGFVGGEDYEDIPIPAGAPAGADYCLTVSGDSMEPYIKDGQLVFVKKDAEIRIFDVGVFCIDGSTYVKQYCPSYDGSVFLLSANPKREDANITVSRDSSSSLVCLGKVLLPKRLPQPVYD